MGWVLTNHDLGDSPLHFIMVEIFKLSSDDKYCPKILGRNQDPRDTEVWINFYRKRRGIQESGGFLVSCESCYQLAPEVSFITVDDQRISVAH